MSFPKIEIKVEGTKSRIYIDGVMVKSVRGYSLTHSASSRDVPVLKMELEACNCTVDGEFLPALPDIFKDFYEPKP